MEITADNWKDKIMGGRSTHLFAIFQDLECRDCRRGATQLAKLANITQEDPVVGRVDCAKNTQLCNTFKGDKSNKQLPFMVYIRNGSIYRYVGGIDAEAIALYIKEEQYKKDENNLLNRSLEEFVAKTEMELNRRRFANVVSDDQTLLGRFIPAFV